MIFITSIQMSYYFFIIYRQPIFLVYCFRVKQFPLNIMFPSGNQSTSANKKPTGASESSDEVYMDVLENNYNFAWGSKSSRRPFSERTHTCILCQEDTQVSMEGPPLVLAGFIQQSTVLLQNK